VEAHSHVGEGHVEVVGIDVWKRTGEDERVRRLVRRIRGADMRERRARVKDMVSCRRWGRQPGEIVRVLGSVPQVR
jgi:hypothetical protein